MRSIPVATPAPSPVASYYSQFSPQAKYASPVHVPQTVQVPAAPPHIVNVKPAQSPQAPQPIQQPQGQYQDRYGQFQDPMATSLKSTPSVVRPQLPGETFSERIVKNMILASTESALGELLLGVRQFLWTPRKPDE